MFVLAFSFDWFTTIPGILISVGVVLLIVALILFVAGSKEPKKVTEEAEVKADEQVTPVAPTADTQVEVAPITPVSNEEMAPVQTETKFEEIKVGVPGVDPIPTTDTVTTEELPKVEEAKETVDTNLDQTMVSVYGNEKTESEVTIPVVEEKKPTIYGGNDPLEATQNLPKMEEHHEPYGGAINDIKIVEPTITQESTEEVKTEEPIEKPVQENGTNSEPFTFEIPAAPVEIPDVKEETPIENTTIEEDKPKVEEL